MNNNNEIFYENVKNQFKEQAKMFNDNFNFVINKMNESKMNQQNKQEKENEIIEEKEKNKENVIEIESQKENEIEIEKEIDDNVIVNKSDEIDKKNEMNLIISDYINNEMNGGNNIINNNKEENLFNDFLIINHDKDINNVNHINKKIENEEKINLIIIPILFFLSKIKSLTENFYENKESINLLKFVEDGNALSPIILDFLEETKNIKENDDSTKKEIYQKYSNILLNILLIKNENNEKRINSPGKILSMILENLDIEENKYLSEQQSIFDLNKNKEYDIYNEKEMLQKFIEYSINHKSFIFDNFYSITKTSKTCKKCNKRSYEYQSFPTLNIYLKRNNSIVNEGDSDYEMLNTLLCQVSLQENIEQLLSPSYDSEIKVYCKSCKKNKETIYNKNIFIIKEYLIINIDRENDQKNEMILIYPEILDLRKQSELIDNVYQLTGVIYKKINKYNYNINENFNDISHYICYFKKPNDNNWICFDENFKEYEVIFNQVNFDFKGVSILIYSKIENK
jgi:hypothetical protein